jgi:hypothetical protein
MSFTTTTATKVHSINADRCMTSFEHLPIVKYLSWSQFPVGRDTTTALYFAGDQLACFCFENGTAATLTDISTVLLSLVSQQWIRHFNDLNSAKSLSR